MFFSQKQNRQRISSPNLQKQASMIPQIFQLAKKFLVMDNFTLIHFDSSNWSNILGTKLTCDLSDSSDFIDENIKNVKVFSLDFLPKKPHFIYPDSFCYKSFFYASKGTFVDKDTYISFESNFSSAFSNVENLADELTYHFSDSLETLSTEMTSLFP